MRFKVEQETEFFKISHFHYVIIIKSFQKDIAPHFSLCVDNLSATYSVFCTSSVYSLFTRQRNIDYYYIKYIESAYNKHGEWLQQNQKKKHRVTFIKRTAYLRFVWHKRTFSVSVLRMKSIERVHLRRNETCITWMHAHMHKQHVYCLRQLSHDDHQSTITVSLNRCLRCLPAYLGSLRNARDKIKCKI